MTMAKIKTAAAGAAKEQLVREKLEKLRTDGGTQARSAVDPEVAADYAEAYKAGRDMPPVKAVRTPDGTYWVWDGHQRLAGARLAGWKTLLVEVREGTLEDARWLAASANQGHGARRTNADKANAVRMALDMRPNMSNRVLADHCGVSESFVRTQRDAARTNCVLNAVETRIGADGKERRVPQRDDESAADDGPPDEGLPAHPMDLPRASAKPSAPSAPEPETPAVRLAAEPEAPAAAPEPELDAVGVPVLAAHREAFSVVPVLDALKAKVQAAINAMRDAMKHPGAASLDALRNLEAARHAVASARPWSRCPYCVGRGGKIDPACRGCGGLGWVIRQVFESAPEAGRAAILALAAGRKGAA
jgi:hypothetical protein